MWLIIDAGNSRIKAALFGDDRSPIQVASIPTNCGREELRSQLIALADGAQVDRAGIAAVSRSEERRVGKEGRERWARYDHAEGRKWEDKRRGGSDGDT